MRRKVWPEAVALRHLQSIPKKGGGFYRYARPPGKKRVTLPDLPLDHPEFLAAYLKAVGEAETPRRKVRDGALSLIIDSFLISEEFLALSADYARVIRREVLEIQAQAQDGDDEALIADLRKTDIEDDLCALHGHKAVARLKAWRILLKYAKGKGHIREDLSSNVKRPATPESDGHPPWTEDEIELYRAQWPIGTIERAAMELVYWSAARRGDAVRIGPGNLGRDGVLSFKQAKLNFRHEAYVPWTCTLPKYAENYLSDRDLMHAALESLPQRHMTFLATRAGRARSKRGLGNLLAAAARKAGFRKSAHGLRKSRCIALAEGGATQHQGMAWSGHLSSQEWQFYIEQANRRKAVRGEERERNVVKSDRTL
jgi:integrase/recombinase XerD